MLSIVYDLKDSFEPYQFRPNTFVYDHMVCMLQSLLKTADQLKIKGLCEVPETRDGPPSVSLSSPPREPGTPRINFTKLKRHHPRYKRPRTTFEPRATDSRHYDRYKEEESNENYNWEHKEVSVSVS